VQQGLRLPGLRRVLMAGAPVPAHLHERFRCILDPAADTHTPYGATEALPVSSISGRDVLAARTEHPSPTAGTCVGRAAPAMELRIIAISDAPIAHWDDSLALPPGQVGEICVRGPTVTKAYMARPESTALAKIADGASIWHRMGDLGYLDDQGRLWFYGRKSQRVHTAEGTLYTEPVELIFNQHPAVFRSALVGVPQEAGGRRQEAGDRDQETRRPGDQETRRPGDKTIPVVIVELRPGQVLRSRDARTRLLAELRELGAAYTMTAGINTFLIHPAFPVDIRHNAKIFREQLAVWAKSVGSRQ
jgi:olefin beta-lactone synthetase